MPLSIFADPKTDFAFKRIFGSEDHKDVLVALLNHMLDLDEAHRRVSEWDAYILAGIAIQNMRGALSVAEKRDEQGGREKACKALPKDTPPAFHCHHGGRPGIPLTAAKPA